MAEVHMHKHLHMHTQLSTNTNSVASRPIRQDKGDVKRANLEICGDARVRVRAMGNGG